MRSLFTVVFVFSVAGCASKPVSPHENYVENDLKYQKAWFIINLNQKIEKNQCDLRCVRVSTTHEVLLDCLKVTGYTDDTGLSYGSKYTARD